QREADDQRHESRELHRDEEELEDVEDLQLVAVVQGRLDQEREDRLGEVERDDEDRGEAQQRIDQPFAQLDQVIEQRHRLVVFGSVVRLGQGKGRLGQARVMPPFGRQFKALIAYSAAALTGFSSVCGALDTGDAVSGAAASEGVASATAVSVAIVSVVASIAVASIAVV